VGLVGGTGISWYAGQIEPDCFAADLILVIYLLTFHGSTLGSVRRILLIALGAFAAAVHPSHLILAGALACALVAVALLQRALRLPLWSDPGHTLPRLGDLALVATAALALVVAANFELTGQVFVTRAGPSFVFARLLQDRIVIRLLDETCPNSAYRLCRYKDELPRTADGWLWTPESPFFALGGFAGTADESARIVRDSLERYPWLHVRWAFADAARQFVLFRTGDQIEPQQWAIGPSLRRYLPGQMQSYMAARQQKGAIDFRAINRVHMPVAVIALTVLLLAIAVFVASGQWRRARALVFVFVALAANAIICGTFSGPHDRYQSRLLWTVPFLLVLVAADRRTPPCGSLGNPAGSAP
jgi:uncharacterized membrane protein YphA (DoxX/SURF4 family)